MSRILNPRRMHERMAKATVQRMRAPATIAAERQNFGHIPAEDGDPVEVPDF